MGLRVNENIVFSEKKERVKQIRNQTFPRKCPPSAGVTGVPLLQVEARDLHGAHAMLDWD
jgi:hypothetical protein